MVVTASLIKELREITSAGMMDCKKALVENDGNIDLAIDWLRKKGIVKAASKSNRIASSGLVTTIVGDKCGYVIEVNAETDFVAKNEKFQNLVKMIANKTVELKGNFDSIFESTKDDVANTIATIGENMNLRRIQKVAGDNIFTYVHNALVPNMGQIGVVVAIDGNDEKIKEIGNKIAMHISAEKPKFLRVEDVDEGSKNKEKDIFIESGATAGKPENIAEKMIEGRLKKYYSESVLEEQEYIMDSSKTVKQVVSEAGGKLAGFAYFLLGEGMEKREDNLADEVANMLK